MIKIFGGVINIASITPLVKLLIGNFKPFNGVLDTIPFIYLCIKISEV
jgi:hypothetical protein